MTGNPLNRLREVSKGKVPIVAMEQPDLDIYTETAIEHAAIAILWQATDASENGGAGFPIGDDDDNGVVRGETQFVQQVIDEVPRLTEVVTDFVRANWNTLQTAGVTAEMCGHDIILTANHHGAGFWDRGLGEAGEALTEATHDYEYELDAEFMIKEVVADDGSLEDQITWLMVMNTVLVDTEGLAAE